MNDLISRGETLKAMQAELEKVADPRVQDGIKGDMELLMMMPVRAHVEEHAVRYGKWLKFGLTLPGALDVYNCSLCKSGYCRMTTYCPNCGAKMGGDDA